MQPFHLAIQVRDLAEAETFYTQFLGCSTGRKSTAWIDLNLYGHQLVCHENKSLGKEGKVSFIKNSVDSHGVPVPHFGVVLEMAQWQQLVGRLQQHKADFEMQPTVRFKGQAGEQATFFLFDPSGNALEFKAFKDIKSQLFDAT